MTSPIFLSLIAVQVFVQANSDAAPQAGVPTAAELSQAISQLGDKDFRVRDRAAVQLLRAGAAAKGQLESGTKSTDPEIAQRSKALLRRLASGIAPEAGETLVDLVEAFGPTNARRSAVIQRLQHLDEFEAIRKLLPTVEGVEERIDLEQQFRDRLCFVALGHFRAEEYEQGEQLLVFNAVDLQGETALNQFLWYAARLPARIADEEARLEQPPAAAACRRLVQMCRAAGDWAKAAKYARLAKDDSLCIWIAAELGDFESALALHRDAIGDRSPTFAQNVTTALLSRQIGDEATLAVASQAITNSVFERNRNHRRAAEAFLATGQYESALAVLERSVPAKAFVLLWKRQEYERAFDRVKASPGSRLDEAWYASLPDGAIAPGAQGVPRKDLALQVIQALCEVGRQQEARRVVELMRAAAAQGPLEYSLDGHVVKGWLLIGDRQQAVEETLLVIEGYEQKRLNAIRSLPSTARVAHPTGFPWAACMALYSQPERNTAIDLWPGFGERYPAGGLPQMLKELDSYLDPAVRDRLTPDQRRAKISELRGMSNGLDEPRRFAFGRGVAAVCRLFGEGDLAERCWDQIMPIARGSAIPAQLRGEQAYLHKDWPAAIRWFETAEQARRTSLPQQQQLAAALLRVGRREEAFMQLDRGRHVASQFNTKASEAKLFAEAGLKDDAVRAFGTGLQLTPPEDKALNSQLHFWIETTRGPLPQAAARAWRLSLFSPSRASQEYPVEAACDFVADLHVERALDLLHRGESVQAVTEAKLAQVASPGNARIAERLVVEFTNTGQNRLADDAFERAWMHFDNLSKKYPSDAIHRHQLAKMSVKCRRRLSAALVRAEEAIELAPAEAAYQDTLAEIHFQLGDRAAAVAAAQKASELAPGNKLFAKRLKHFQEDELKTLDGNEE
jgi:tetratricopeptide (TPR) repeat protein